MLAENSYKNPFSDYNANTLDSEQITHFWETPFDKYVTNISEDEFAFEKTPIIFTGGRGTGKTMILKYFDIASEIVRAGQEKIELKKFIEQNGYIGLYIRFDTPLLKGFEGLGLDNDKWVGIFTHFFEVTVGKAFLDALCKLESHRVISYGEVKLIVERLEQITFHKGLTLKDYAEWFRNEINYVNKFRTDIIFENVIFTPQKRFSSGDLTKTIASSIKEVCPFFSKINFLVLLDEYENFLEYEQKIVNSSIKFVKEIAFRIGMRPMGFHTFDTISENEFIKENRDYRNITLENPLIKKDNDNGYFEFLLKIAEKRLKNVNLFAEKGMTDLRKFLGNREDPVIEARKIVKGRTKHIDAYIKEIKKEYKKRNLIFSITPVQLNKLRDEKNPLLEIQNMRLLLKPYPIKNVIKAFTDYKEGNDTEERNKYKYDYVDKYKLAYLFVLRSIYRVESKLYYGFNDFAYLSSGIVGTYIELCRCVFQYAFFTNKEELFQGYISPEIQTKAARDVGKSELDQVKRISKVGNNVYNLATNIGAKFYKYHIDKRISYPETNQFSFNSSTLEKNTLEYDTFQAAIMWSVVQKKKDLQQAGIGKKDAEVYILNRIFAPVFNISARTRGGHNEELNIAKFSKYIGNESDVVQLSLFPGIAEQNGSDED